MNTIILNKRVMSPANILNNVVEGDIKLLKKAQEYFTKACRSTVGYKQLANYLSINVVVISASPSISVPVSKCDNLQYPLNELRHDLLRYKTLSLNNVDNIIKRAFKRDKDLLSNEDKKIFRELCIQVRERIKDVIFSLPRGWYYTPTDNLRPIIDELLLPKIIEESPQLELVEEDFIDDTPWYV